MINTVLYFKKFKLNIDNVYSINIRKKGGILMKKKLVTLFLLVVMIFSISIPTYAANTFTFTHGNESNRCFAETSQTGDASIGAQISWQLNGKNTVVYGDKVSSYGATAKSRSKWLWGKEGKSFGYYYVNGSLAHRSTAWMNFDF